MANTDVKGTSDSKSFPSEPKAKAFLAHLQKFCTQNGYDLEIMRNWDTPQIRIVFAGPHFPMWLRIDVDEPSNRAFVVGVVRTYGFAGDRSDYHELLSLIWASVLRAWNHASPRLIDIPHPVVPGELWGRYLMVENQPSWTFISLDRPDYEGIEKLVLVSATAAYVFSTLYRGSLGDPELEYCESGQTWAGKIRSCGKWKTNHLRELSNHRLHPHWYFYSRPDKGITAFQLSVDLFALFAGKQASPNASILEGQNALLINTENIRNIIDKQSAAKAKRLLRAYGLNEESLALSLSGKSVVYLPTDSHLICVTKKGILAITAEGGLDEYLRCESLLRERHQKEAVILHSALKFKWESHINDDRFEELIRDLLSREPGVRWVRRVGSSRASDGERDLIVDWIARPAPWQAATETTALVCRKVIVQCKAFSGSINRSKVGDVPGTVDLHGADGYLLVAFPRVTPALIDYLNTVPPKRQIWADWWTQPELEDRLRVNLDIAARYTDLFSTSQ